jgi:hypothetical protein
MLDFLEQPFWAHTALLWVFVLVAASLRATTALRVPLVDSVCLAPHSNADIRVRRFDPDDPSVYDAFFQGESA